MLPYAKKSDVASASQLQDTTVDARPAKPRNSLSRYSFSPLPQTLFDNSQAFCKHGCDGSGYLAKEPNTDLRSTAESGKARLYLL